jgi:hypothetical protein
LLCVAYPWAMAWGLVIFFEVRLQLKCKLNLDETEIK